MYISRLFDGFCLISKTSFILTKQMSIAKPCAENVEVIYFYFLISKAPEDTSPVASAKGLKR